MCVFVDNVLGSFRIDVQSEISNAWSVQKRISEAHTIFRQTRTYFENIFT